MDGGDSEFYEALRLMGAQDVYPVCSWCGAELMAAGDRDFSIEKGGLVTRERYSCESCGEAYALWYKLDHDGGWDFWLTRYARS